MNAISLRTRVEPCICATDSSRWITLDSFRKSICRLKWPRQHPNETFSLRAQRELEDRSRANALEPDALNAHGTRGHYRDNRCHVDGHGRERHLDRFRQKHG